jgi:hypothetical protein
MKTMFKYSMLALALFSASCQENSTDSQIKVTSVKHTSVKRQAIGNCWLYAQATWLESLLKDTTGEDVDVSETYWTYWDLYTKLMEREPIPEEELNTGGNWWMSSNIIRNYGWVTEAEFIDSEAGETMSEAQACAEDYIMEQGKEGGTLHDVNLRSRDYVRAELDKAFSCNGKYTVNMDAALEKSRKATDTMLKDVKSGREYSLSTMLNRWRQAYHPNPSSLSGKKLLSKTELQSFRDIEQRIKKALNDHYPVVLSFYVDFNAANSRGIFNLDTLAEKGELGSGGGHMVVLHDYTVDNVPSDDGFISLGEGDLAPELKTLAAEYGELNYLVAKNSWGSNRMDRPWLRDGYSRFTWDYLKNRYWNEKTENYRSFFQSVVLPLGY